MTGESNVGGYLSNAASLLEEWELHINKKGGLWLYAISLPSIMLIVQAKQENVRTLTLAPRLIEPVLRKPVYHFLHAFLWCTLCRE